VTDQPRADGTQASGTSLIPTIGGPLRLIFDNRVDPRWSPDAHLQAKSKTRMGSQFCLVNLENRERRVKRISVPDARNRSFDVKPDRKRILFDRVEENPDLAMIEPGRR